MKTSSRLFTFAAVLLVMFAGPAAAGESSTPVLGYSYWQGFRDYWSGTFQKQDGVAMAILAVGAVALFIITRGKWQK